MHVGAIKSPTINYIHGWGLSPRFWDRFKVQWPNSKPSFTNLQFTDKPDRQLNISCPSTDYVIAHSLGGLWALKNNVYPRLGMVFINSFYKFAPFGDRHILQAMQKALKQDPHQQMIRFLKQADCESQVRADIQWNTDQLLQGLDWLQKWGATVELTTLNCPILVLAGAQDRICALEKMEQHWQGHDIVVHPDGGHALPLSHPEWCAAQIKKWMDKHHGNQ